eukprot:5773578-Pleurochrysis_carterae.AAC.1
MEATDTSGAELAAAECLDCSGDRTKADCAATTESSCCKGKRVGVDPDLFPRLSSTTWLRAGAPRKSRLASGRRSDCPARIRLMKAAACWARLRSWTVHSGSLGRVHEALEGRMASRLWWECLLVEQSPPNGCRHEAGLVEQRHLLSASELRRALERCCFDARASMRRD